MPAPMFDPFNLSPDDIRLMAGETTPEETRLIKAVLNGVRAKVHQYDVGVANGMTHNNSCWSWGPSHYMCAYNRITAMNRERPALSIPQVAELAARLNLPIDTVETVTRAVEDHHVIGGSR